MVVKHLAVALLGSALIAAPALAQTSTGSGAAGTSGATTTSPSTGAAPAMNNTTGSSAAGSSSMDSSSAMTQMKPGQWRASQIEGLDVYNQNNEKVGDISEMLIDESGKIQAVVIGVGGFLGIGERDVAVPFDQVKFMNEPRANATAANNTATGTTGAGGTAGTAGTTAATPNTTGSVGNTTAGTATTANTGNNAERTGPDHAMVNMTKDQAKAMPEFKYNQ
jgi:sporulation protein YlmC with PRC-barrel domain